MFSGVTGIKQKAIGSEDYFYVLEYRTALPCQPVLGFLGKGLLL